ncbi:nephrin-like [Haliotis asinina]|uniref:nephrin-like n=1 Tax=Haliotis asinina TaxID=109174 RepID=UPI003531ADA6
MSRRVSFLELIPLLVLLDTTNIPPCESAPVLATNRRVPVEGVSFSFTCTLDAAIGGTALFYKGLTSNQGGCLSSGRCGTSVSGYNVSLDSTSRILTLDIASAVSTRDNGTWRCTDGATGSNSVTLSQFAAVLDWSSVIFSPQLTSLPSSVTPQNTISVSVTTPCAAPAAVITWRYQQGVSGVPPSNTSSTQGSCPSGQVQTTNTLSLPGNTIVSFYNRQVSLTVSVEHDSFDPPTYTKSVTSNTIQFPVPVSSVTLTNIKSENEKIGQEVGQTLTLTCVTSASFPTSVVTWTTLPPGTTPTVSTETTSGVLAKTTSFVTFIVSRSDQGRSIRCQAENVNGQASKQSKKAILEVWFGPEQVDVTMPENSVTLENSDLTLTCGTAGYPNVTFTWDYSDGTPVGGSTGSVAESSTWWSQTITFRPNKDKTAVRCHVRNTITNTTKTLSVSLDVKYPPYEPPSITQFPAVMFEGDQETIRCSVTGGNPLATITWSCPGTGSASVSDSGQTRTSTLSFTVSRSQNGQQCECLGAWQYGGYNYTDVRTFNVSCPTNPQPPKAECNMTGVIAGTAIGTLLITLLIGGLVLAVLNRKGFRFGNVMKEKASPKSRRNPECEENENIGYSSLDQISSPAQGMGTEGSERHYTQLKVYENTNVEPKAETSTYEDMTETPPVAYESIRASPAALSRDPDYGNT